MTQATICFLVDDEENDRKVSLVMKKQSFSEGLWNGLVGKATKSDKSVELATLRVVKEKVDIRIDKLDLKKVGLIKYQYTNNPSWNKLVHIFIANDWFGDPKESDETFLKWFTFDQIPYDDMCSDYQYWLDDILEGNLVQGEMKFGVDNELLEVDLSNPSLLIA